MSEEPAAFEAWLDDVGLDDWPVPTDPEKQAQLLRELTAVSRWEDASERAIDLQLVDVVPIDAGWKSQPLTRRDTRVLAKAIRQWTGLPVKIELIELSVGYEETWHDKAQELGPARVYTPGVWTPPGIDPERPWLMTYAAQADAAGKRIVVSASGGQVDAGAWVGSTARPITADNAQLYAHELLHAMGHQHHYTPALYNPGVDRSQPEPYLISTDCIMANGYSEDMEPLLCPICRYRVHPAHSRAWARRYRKMAKVYGSSHP